MLVKLDHLPNFRGEHNTLEVQDQTKNGLLDDPCKGFPTTNGQSLVFGLPGNTYLKPPHRKSMVGKLGFILGKKAYKVDPYQI